MHEPWFSGQGRRGLEHLAVLSIVWELLVGLAGNGYLHEGHPDGESGTRAGFLFAQRFTAVEANPDSASNRWREAEEPGIGKVACGPGLAAQWMVHLRDSSAGAMGGHRLQKRHHGARRLLVDDLVDFGAIFPEGDAICVGDLADKVRRDAHSVIGKC